MAVSLRQVFAGEYLNLHKVFAHFIFAHPEIDSKILVEGAATLLKKNSFTGIYY